MMVEASDPDEARWIVPAPLRAAAEVVGLNRFDSAHIDEILSRHGNP